MRCWTKSHILSASGAYWMSVATVVCALCVSRLSGEWKQTEYIPVRNGHLANTQSGQVRQHVKYYYCYRKSQRNGQVNSQFTSTRLHVPRAEIKKNYIFRHWLCFVDEENAGVEWTWVCTVLIGQQNNQFQIGLCDVRVNRFDPKSLPAAVDSINFFISSAHDLSSLSFCINTSR